MTREVSTIAYQKPRSPTGCSLNSWKLAARKELKKTSFQEINEFGKNLDSPGVKPLVGVPGIKPLVGVPGVKPLVGIPGVKPQEGLPVA